MSIINVISTFFKCLSFPLKQIFPHFQSNSGILSKSRENCVLATETSVIRALLAYPCVFSKSNTQMENTLCFVALVAKEMATTDDYATRKSENV